MAKKYMIVRMPFDTYTNFKLKQSRMEETLKKIKGKKIALPFTKVLDTISKQKFFLYDEDILNLKRKRR